MDRDAWRAMVHGVIQLHSDQWITQGLGHAAQWGFQATAASENFSWPL